jgi:hypothetical protein
VVRRFVLSKNLKNEEAMTCLRPQCLVVVSAVSPLLTKTPDFVGTMFILQVKNSEVEQVNNLKMEASDYSETLMHLYQTTRSKIPKAGDIKEEKTLRCVLI